MLNVVVANKLDLFGLTVSVLVGACIADIVRGRWSNWRLDIAVGVPGGRSGEDIRGALLAGGLSGTYRNDVVLRGAAIGAAGSLLDVEDSASLSGGHVVAFPSCRICEDRCPFAIGASTSPLES